MQICKNVLLHNQDKKKKLQEKNLRITDGPIKFPLRLIVKIREKIRSKNQSTDYQRLIKGGHIT